MLIIGEYETVIKLSTSYYFQIIDIVDGYWVLLFRVSFTCKLYFTIDFFYFTNQKTKRITRNAN